MGRKEFKESLKSGESAEHILMDMVRRQGKTPHKPEVEDKQFKLYDFIVYETKLAYEVKRDWKSAHTGNIVVEIEMPPGKPSGLQTTIADFWVFDLPDEYIVAKPDRLRDMLAYEGLGSCEFIGKGDTTPKTAYLVKIGIVKRYADGVYKK